MRDLTLNSTSSWLAQFPDSIFKLQQKGRVVCTVPSPISHFWQFFIYQPHCTLIKWVFFFFLNIVSKFFGIDPNIGANVLCWESFLSASIASGFVFFILTFSHLLVGVSTLHSGCCYHRLFLFFHWLTELICNLTLGKHF